MGAFKTIAETLSMVLMDRPDLKRVTAMIAMRSLEERLRESEERLKVLVDFSSDGYWEQDAHFRFTELWQKNASSALPDEEETTGKTWWELPHVGMAEDQWEEQWGRYKALLHARQPFHDFVVKRVDLAGQQRFVSVSGAPMFDSVGNLTGYRGIAKDITERIHAEQRSVLEHAVTGLLAESKDPSTVIREILQAFCEILGWDYGSYSNLGEVNKVMLRTEVWSSPSIDAAELMSGSGQRKPGDPRSSVSGMRRRAWDAAAPIWVSDVTRDPTFRRAAVAARIGIHAAVAFPIFADGVVLGVMEFYSREVRRQDDLLLGSVRFIGDQIGQFYQRKRMESSLVMEHAVTRLLAASDTPAETMPKILRTVCETLGWQYGCYWSLDEQTQSVSCTATWHVASLEGSEFVSYVRNKVFDVTLLKTPREGAGFMRRIWTTAEPIWVYDITAGTTSPRATIASKAMLHSVFSFPVRVGQEVIGALEFFGEAIRQPDELLMETARSIGTQIGQFCRRKQTEERIQYLAYNDGLTGLPNRSLFSQSLNHALMLARRNKKNISVLFIDLDRFKNINDTLGHEAGDYLLQVMAARFKACVRESDMVARLGGDEFVILLEDMADPKHAAYVAQKIISTAQSPFTFNAGDYHVTASVGISVYPEDGEDDQALMKHADIAMYLAKDKGKNNYQFYSTQINTHSFERLALESSLRHALERHEFVVHYQAKVDLDSGCVTGMEALLRWVHPDLGMVSPALFMPLAEETGLIVPIGRWVLDTVCAQNKTWQEQGLPSLCVSVNLSARQFNDEGLLRDVARALADSGLSPNLLELELTESMVMYDPDKAVRLLSDMRAMGISIAIDDFGIGYSSLSQLKRFPVNTIKIDRSFIKDLISNKEDAAIAGAIIAMGTKLNLNVIAEGVETDAQVRFLRDHKCNEMQGFCFSKPILADEFAQLLRSGTIFSSQDPAE